MPAFLNKLAVRVSVCLALVVLGVIFALCFRLPAHLVLQTGDNAYPVGPITSRAAFVQELNITGPVRIASLEVLLATWGKPANTTHDEIRVFDGSGRQVQAMKLPPGTVADNAYVRVDLPDPIEIDGRGRFFVSLSSSDGSKADSITAWATHATQAGRLYSLPSADLGHGSLVAMIDAARPLEGAICVRVLGQGPRRLLAEKALRVGGLLVFLALAACVWWSRLFSTPKGLHVKTDSPEDHVTTEQPWRPQEASPRVVAGRRASARLRTRLRRLVPVALVLDLYAHRDLIRQFAWRDVASRYKGSYLGLIWSFVTPLLMLIVYAFVFSVVFQSRWGTGGQDSRVDFALILFCGLTTFNVFGECVSRAPGLVLGYPSYVKKVVFPLQTLNVSVLLSSLVNLGIGVAIVLVAWVAVHHSVSTTIWAFPLVLIPLCSLSLGLGWVISSIGVFVRDLAQPITIIVSVLFFMSGIFFPLDAVPAGMQLYMRLNPLSTILEDARRTLLWSKYPDWKWWGITTAASLAIMLLGYMWFTRTKKAFADVI